jgi:Adenylate and Guanylate cyclase catalytic domain
VHVQNRRVSRIEIRDLGEPEAVVRYPLGASYQVRLAGTVVSHHVLQPGWSWEAHAQPQVGTASCELYHRGVVLSGRMGVRTDEGEEVVIGPNQVFDLPPGHLTWVQGDEELVMVDWAGGAGFDVQPGERARVLATILFTDMVESTAQAQEAGDAAWKQTVAMHDDVVRTVLVRFGGREVETAGDSFLIVFDGAERAIRCGLDLVEALAAIKLSIRVGISQRRSRAERRGRSRCGGPHGRSRHGRGGVRGGARVGDHPGPCRGRFWTGIRAARAVRAQGHRAAAPPLRRIRR